MFRRLSVGLLLWLLDIVPFPETRDNGYIYWAFVSYLVLYDIYCNWYNFVSLWLTNIYDFLIMTVSFVLLYDHSIWWWLSYFIYLLLFQSSLFCLGHLLLEVFVPILVYFSSLFCLGRLFLDLFGPSWGFFRSDNNSSTIEEQIKKHMRIISL